MNDPRLIAAYFLQDGSGKKYYEWTGDSSMSKPVLANAAQGSLFHEVDTATLYAWDEGTQNWYKQIELGGAD